MAKTVSMCSHVGSTLVSFLEAKSNFPIDLQSYDPLIKTNPKLKMMIVHQKKIIKTQKKEADSTKMSHHRKRLINAY